MKRGFSFSVMYHLSLETEQQPSFQNECVLRGTGIGPPLIRTSTRTSPLSLFEYKQENLWDSGGSDLEFE